MRRMWFGLGAALVSGPACEPAASRCGDGAPEVGVFCFPDREVVRVGHGFAPEAIALLDVDDDGNLDLAAVNPARQTLSVTWGGPDGSFTRLTSWPIGETVAGLAHGDLDGDGNLDLASALPDSDAVAVLYGNGKREFTLRRHAAGDTPHNILALDLDGGPPELVTANLGDGSLSVLRRGVADPPTIVGGGPFGLAAGDLDGDGSTDLAVTLREADAVQVMRNAAGVLVPGAYHQVGRVPGTIVVGELDGDSELDLATADELGGTVSVVLGDGAGGAREHMRWPVMQQPNGLAIVRGGGVPAVLAVLSAETSELLRLDPRTGATAPGGTAGVASAIAAADLDRDGREEIVYGARAEGTVGGLVPGEGVRLTSQWRAPAVATLAAVDIGGDGIEELVVALDDGDLAIWRGPEDAFTAEPIHHRLTSVRSILRGDLDGDGLDDLVLLGRRGNSPRDAITTLVQADGGFRITAVSMEPPGQVDRLLLGDVGGDGIVDVVFTTNNYPAGRQLMWLRGDGHGELGAPELVDGHGPQVLASIDIDGDAALDLVGLGSDGRQVYIVEDVTAGNEPSAIETPRGVFDMAAADLDDDGKPDLLICVPEGMHRIADPIGAPSTRTVVITDPCIQIEPRDLDADGDLDVLVQLFDSGVLANRLRLGVLLNDGAGVLSDLGQPVIPGRVQAFTTLAGGAGWPRIVVSTTDLVESFAFELGPALVETPRGELGAPMAGHFADLDGDGQPDWRAANRRELAVAFGRDGGVGPTQHVPLTGLVEADVSELVSMVHADLDDDGADELVLLGLVDNPTVPLRSLAVIRVDAPGEFRGELVTRLAGAVNSVMARDLDGDRRVDLLTVERTQDHIRLTRLPGRGDGSFEPALSQQLVISDVYGSPSLAALDGDDRLDLVISTTEGLYVARGQEGGDFDSPRIWWHTNNVIRDFVPGDFNADRRLDLVVSGNSGLLLLRGDGEGNLGTPRELLAGYGTQVTAADLDGDGVAELIVMTYDISGARLWTGRNSGDGGFVFTSRPWSAPFAQHISVLDLDSDDAPEIVVHDGGGLTIVRQQP